MKQRLFYKNYYLGAMSSQTEDGRFHARVAVMVLDSGSTRSQRFLDFHIHDTEAQADLEAIESAKEWIDAQTSRDGFRQVTNLAAL